MGILCVGACRPKSGEQDLEDQYENIAASGKIQFSLIYNFNNLKPINEAHLDQFNSQGPEQKVKCTCENIEFAL
jgi:hypothetical protein